MSCHKGVTPRPAVYPMHTQTMEPQERTLWQKTDTGVPLSSITKILTHSVPAREAVRVNKQLHVCEEKQWHVCMPSYSIGTLCLFACSSPFDSCLEPWNVVSLSCNGTRNEGSQMPCTKYHNPKLKFENRDRMSHTFTSFHFHVSQANLCPVWTCVDPQL